MKKKIFGKISVILIMTLMITSVFGIQTVIATSEVDQEQTDWNQYAAITNNPDAQISHAQSFKPSKTPLCSVDLLVCKNLNPSKNLIFSIRESKDETPLRTVSKSPSEFSTSEEWISFDFGDLDVTIGQPYYIVLEKEYENNYEMYMWCVKDGGNPYTEGALWFKINNEPWSQNTYDGYDATFKTYTTTPSNDPPNTPSNPDPFNGKTNVGVHHDLYWSGGDPNSGDAVNYDIYFDTNNPPQYITTIGPYDWDETRISWDTGTMNYDTTYYWKIEAVDEHGKPANPQGPIWHFTTESEPNNPPYTPNNPSPGNGAIDADVDADLSWTGGDPDPGDTVKYDVYFGTSQSNLDMVSKDQSGTTYDPGTLEFEKTYYWKIIAEDNHGATTTGSVWHFTTMEWDCSDLPNLYFPRATKAKIDTLYIGTDIVWTLSEGISYPLGYGYEATHNKLHKTATSKLYDIHNGACCEPFSGLGFPELHVLETLVGYKYTFPSCGGNWEYTSPSRVTISGKYGMDGLEGLLETGWLGRADIDISLVIRNEDLDCQLEYKIGHYGIGPIEPDDWYNIQDSFSVQTSEDIHFYYGHTYTFYLRSKASLFLTSQGVPILLSIILPDANGWGRAYIGAKFNNIQIIWQGARGGGSNPPPSIPGESYGSKGIVNEEHIFYSNGSTDPDNNAVFYKWHWDDGSTSEWMGPYASGDPVPASHTYTKPGIYNVRLEAKDQFGAWSGLSEDSFSRMWYPEGEIIVDSPASGDEWYQYGTYGITWSCSGYTGDQVQIALYHGDGDGNYEFYNYITPNPIQNSGSYSWYIDSNTLGGDDYRIVVCDLTNAANCSDSFSIIAHLPPNIPDNPNPSDGASRVGKNPTLSWNSGDLESGDTVTYKIYLGEDPDFGEEPYDIIGPYPATQTRIQYTITEDLKRFTWYYWKIVAIDNHGATIEGPIWSFRTKLFWINVVPAPVAQSATAESSSSGANVQPR